MIERTILKSKPRGIHHTKHNICLLLRTQFLLSLLDHAFGGISQDQPVESYGWRRPFRHEFDRVWYMHYNGVAGFGHTLHLRDSSPDFDLAATAKRSH